MELSPFDSFFESYSKNVDRADMLYFWKLSDQIIEKLLHKHIIAMPDSPSCILDAGGGTGRWIIKLAQHLPSTFILYDRSPAMLAQAEKNITKANLLDRVTLREGNLCAMDSIPSESIDAIISIYNPLSFVDEPRKAVVELCRILKKGGVIVVMGQNFYNALYSKINNFLASADELINIENKQCVQWTTGVPPLHMFSKESLEKLFLDESCDILATYGIPVFAQPTVEDFDSENKQRGRLSQKLENDPLFFEAVLDIEMKYNSLPNVANRGMNLMMVARKL